MTTDQTAELVIRSDAGTKAVNKEICAGIWTLHGIAHIEQQLKGTVWSAGADMEMDSSAISALDISGAWLLHKTVSMLFAARMSSTDHRFAASRWADTPARMPGPLIAHVLEQAESFRLVRRALTINRPPQSWCNCRHPVRSRHLLPVHAGDHVAPSVRWRQLRRVLRALQLPPCHHCGCVPSRRSPDFALDGASSRGRTPLAPGHGSRGAVSS